MDSGSNYAVAESANFMDFRLLLANTTDKLKSVIGPPKRVQSLTNGSNWLASRHNIEELTVETVNEKKSYSDYIKKRV